MSDLIERKAAIDVLDKIFPVDPMRNDYTQGITCGAALATEYIKQLPSAEPRWVPVTERLPEKRDYYLITTEKTHDVDICWWNGSRFESYPGGCLVVLRPQAWLPLPEPYEGAD